MPTLRRCALLVLALAVTAVHAQQDGSEWLSSAPAREFRMRVAQLAVIYGDARGIDPRGLLVTGRRIGETAGDCAEVEIAVLQAQQEILREQLRACRHGSPS